MICLPLKGSITSNSNPGGGHLVSRFTLLLPVCDTGIIIRVGPDTGYLSDYICRISGVDWIFGRTTGNCGKKRLSIFFFIFPMSVCPFKRPSILKCINCNQLIAIIPRIKKIMLLSVCLKRFLLLNIISITCIRPNIEMTGYPA